MKKLIVPIICVAVLGLMFSCRKVNNPRLGSLSEVPLPLLTDSSAPGDELISSDANFSRTFTVDVYYKNGIQPKQMDVVVAKNGVATNYNDTSIKVIQTGLTSFPASVTIDSAEIVALFGPIHLGDIYEFGVNVTAPDGTVYPAFVAGTDSLNGGSAYGTDVSKLPGANVIITYKSPCAYDGTIFNGSYTVTEDDWADFSPGDAVPNVTDNPGSGTISITLYPNPSFGTNRQPFIVDIDTTNAGTGNATVASQVIGDYGSSDPNMKVKTSGTGSFVDFCSGSIHLDLDFSDANGDYGVYTLVIDK